MNIIKFDNLFEYGDSIEIKVSDASYEIMKYLKNIYEYIFKVFENGDNDEVKEKSTKEIYDKLIDKLSFEPPSLDSSPTKFPNEISEKELLDSLKTTNYEKIVACLEYDINTPMPINYLLYDILYYSIFDFDCYYNYYKGDGNDLKIDNSNLKYYKQDYKNGQTYYHFINDNQLFKIIDKITNYNFSNNFTASLNPKGELGFNRINNIPFKTLLLDGYYYDSPEDEIYYCFKTEKQIKEFILNFLTSFVSPNYLTFGDSFGISSKRFRIKLEDVSLYKTWAVKIQTIITRIIEPTLESESKETYDEFEFGDNLTPIKLWVSGNNKVKNIIKEYCDIYWYFIKILNSYLDVLKISSNKSLFEDDIVKKLLNKITGSKKDSNYFETENKSFKTDEADTSLIEYYIQKNISDYKTYIGGTVVENNSSNIAMKKIKTPKTIKGAFDISGNEKSNTGLLDNLIITDSNDIQNFVERNRQVGLIRNYIVKNFKKLFLDCPMQFIELGVFSEINNDLIYNEQNINISKEEINLLSGFGGNLISKTSFLCFYKFDIIQGQNINIGFDSPGTRRGEIILPSFNIDTIHEYLSTPKINGADYTTYESLYNDFGRLVYNYIKSLIELKEQQRGQYNTQANEKINSSNFASYIADRMTSGYFTEDDFFYLRKDKNGKNKKAPSNSFVDVEFKIPRQIKENGERVVDWIPVSSIRNYNNRENDITVNSDIDLHAGSYFDSFELTDDAGVKKITLTLKSVNDMNLEDIIYRSLEMDNSPTLYKNENKIVENENVDILSFLKQVVENGTGNFRIRFGYRDVADKVKDEESTISTMNPDDEDFIKRTKSLNINGEEIVKPVQVYPWTYFKITNISSSIKDGEDTYTISGVSTGSYVLENLTLNGVHTNFTGYSNNNNISNENSPYKGNPKNVAGRISNWITKASYTTQDDISSARIVFLGDEPGTIISDYKSDGTILSNYNYVLKNGGSVFEGGNLQSIENSFFDSNLRITAKNFSLLNNYKTLSIKEILDKLAEWLPPRIYYIAKDESGRTAALNISYDSIYRVNNFFSTCPFKTEGITYQIIEADANIYKAKEIEKASTSYVSSNNSINRRIQKDINNKYEEQKANERKKYWSGLNKDTDFHKVYFIRMYYRGPGVTSFNNNQDYLRVYNYRSTQNQVIQSIEFENNDTEFGNLISSVTMLGTAGKPVVFLYNRDTAKLDEGIFNAETGENVNINEKVKKNVATRVEADSYNGEDNSRPYFSFNNSNYIQYESYLENDAQDLALSNKQEAASRFFTAQQNKLYKGQITILGDPFYYFDSSVEAGKYEIYLQMNRIKNRATYSMGDSRYTGIYFLTGIRHNFDSSGKYTTTLSVAKRIFGASASDEEDSSESDFSDED